MRKVVLCILIALAGCKSDDSLQSKDINQAWLNAHIDEINKSDLKQYFYIVKAEYEGECIVYVSNCCPMCSSIIIPYRCNGTKLDGIDLTKIVNHTIAWKPDNFSCSL